MSMISIDSDDAFGRTIGQPIDAALFQGSIVLAGIPAFHEWDLIGRTLQIGEVQIHILKRTRRCAAIEVILETGGRDVKVRYFLCKHFGHMDMGVYAELICGGLIAIGDEIVVH